MMTSLTQAIVRNCDGGHYCSPPKECCKQGCCYLPGPSVSYRPPTLPTTSMLNPLFLGHWYFWAAVTATVAGILCACSLWRRHSQRSLCCRNSGRDDRASEPDSNGSCYAPPHYSRCNSFHQAPPPYSEVTSKPDLYPLVISYNGFNMESNQKVGRGSTGYLMVQYFRNYIVRPVGTLSATSTMDSLGSSFICNAANEANSIIPPPYSCTGSLEEVNVSNSNPTRSSSEFPRSISSATCNDFHLAQHSPGNCSQNSHNPPQQIVSSSSLNITTVNNNYSNVNSSSQILNATANNNSINNSNNNNKEVSITSNPCYMPNPLNNVAGIVEYSVAPRITSNRSNEYPERQTYSRDCTCTQINTPRRLARKQNESNSLDCESQEDDHNNFSDLLNLSVCLPNTITQLPLGTMTSSLQTHEAQPFSVVSSITSSDVSSLANLGTPDSPPRATSPTAELRELLDKIQQLPQHKSPIPLDTSNASHREPRTRSCFGRNKAKTLYMPLNECAAYSCSSRLSPGGMFGKGTKKSWLSRSAPTTPCSNFVPSFPVNKKQTGSQKGSKGKICDGSPLLNENDESDEEQHRGQYS